MADQVNRRASWLSEVLQRVGDSERGHDLVTGTPAAREVARRFVPVTDIGAVLDLVARQREMGLFATLEPLLPVSGDREMASRAVEVHLDSIAAIAERGLADVTEISVRPTTIGLKIGREGRALATRNLQTICRAAANASVRVTLDMEDHTTVDDTFAIFSEVYQDFHLLGVTVQSQLRRALVDCRWLATMPVRVRLCKGGYSEPRSVSFDDRAEIDASFVRCMAVLMAGKGYPMLATHDPRLVKMALELAARNHRGRADFEFQMYYGVRPWEHRRLVDVGHAVRVHVPFGPDWYSYLVRRVAERPANVMPLLRALVTRR